MMRDSLTRSLGLYRVEMDRPLNGLLTSMMSMLVRKTSSDSCSMRLFSGLRYGLLETCEL